MNPDTRTQPDWRLLVAILVSLLIHLIGVATLVSGGAPEARLDLGAILEPREAQETRLGLEQSKTVSVAWLGFETPTEHLAAQSRVEQSQLELDPGERGSAMTAEQFAQAAAAGAAQARRAAQAAAEALEALANQAADAIRLTREPSPQPEQEAGAPPAPTTPAEQPDDGGAGGAGEGQQADKEADASSLKEPVDVPIFGQVAVGQGLEIFTRRDPKLTTLVRRLARPRNPLVEISFKGDGSVERAAYRRGETTGYVAIDEPLLDAMYAWRARGARIDALGEGQTLTIVIRVLLN
ncbi:MAG: hypothetical protein ACF8R7_02245 [Phycisphaerales bacterium JB039]